MHKIIIEMKDKLISIVLVIGLVFLICSCGLDNYSEPEAGIKGKIIDSKSNKPIQTVQPNGFQIRLIEISSKYKNPVPIDFWGKADGTYKNTKLFADKYKVIPINGAFFKPDTATVILHSGKISTVNFTVTPFLEITNVSVTPTSGGAIVKYQIVKSSKSNKIITSESLASRYPSVAHTVFEQKVSHDLSNTQDKLITNTLFKDTISGLISGETYYIRVAARTDNANNRYNYSKVFKITIQ